MDKRSLAALAPLVLAGILAIDFGAWAEDNGEPAMVAAKDEVQSSPEEFLALVRSPFRDEAWGRFSGEVVHVQPDGKEKASIALAILFGAESTKVRVVLNEQNSYGIEQMHAAGGPGRVILKMPEPEQKPGLSDLGLDPGDITMAFIYWSFIRELPAESLRQQPCRVMDLQHPENKGYARVWFSRDYGFPLRVYWFRPDEQTPWRKLEFKGFKRHADGVWFMKTVQLSGDKWKTLVDFEDAELHRPTEAPVPPDLFPAGQ